MDGTVNMEHEMKHVSVRRANRTYGVPYKGSKNQIARSIVDMLPRGERFVDLFAGGCAMTHAAIESGKYKSFLANDIDGNGVRLFVNAVRGLYDGETRFISREDFFSLKDTDPYVRLCWSFGNNARTYMYSRKIEPYKRAYHHAYFFGDYAPAHELGIDVLDGIHLYRVEDRYREMKRRLAEWWSHPGRTLMSKNAHGSGKCMMSEHSTKSLQSLESLQRLNRINELRGICDIEVSSASCYAYQHRDGDVVYCDPPYADTNGYDGRSSKTKFDSEAFFSWAESRPYPVFISEYQVPPGFSPVWRRRKASRMCAQLQKGKYNTEFVSVQCRFAEKYRT